MIRLIDLAAQHAEIEGELNAAVQGVIASGRFVLGDNVAAFEQAFADHCGVAHAVGVNSGASALHLALRAAGVGAGDEVITTPMTFVATVAAIQDAGATPRLVDVDPRTWTMDPGRIEAAITPRTRAILPVHLHGRLADMAPILDIARARGLIVIEDAAQAHGAQRDGRRAGAFGDLGCFSFYPGKNLGGLGDGGAVVTDRADLAARLRRLRDWGQARKNEHVERGFNARLDEIQAAALRVKLPRLEAWNDRRRVLAARYDQNLDGGPLGLPSPSDGGDHVYHVYAVRAPARDALRARLAPRVETGVHYARPAHLLPAFADLGYRAGDFPAAERLARGTLSLPIHPALTLAQVDQVCAELLAAVTPRAWAS
jgi:dTDP-4-amino-4,6-dideoxygalactose transaminase